MGAADLFVVLVRSDDLSAKFVSIPLLSIALKCSTVKRTEDHIAYATLDAENLSLYALPFESAFMAFGRQLLGMEDFWKELQLRAEW